MATTLEDSCAICLDTQTNAACTVPCLHRFCFGCIQRWAEIKPECPLCKTRVTSIRRLLGGDKFEEIPTRPCAASLVSAQDEGPYELLSPRALRVDQPGNPEGFVGGLHPSTWGFLFRNHPDFLELLQPWLHQELGYIFGEEHFQVRTLENMILSALLIVYRLEELLVEELQADPQNHATAFVQDIEFAVDWYASAAHRLLLFWDIHGARGFEESPEDTTSSAVFTKWPEHSPMASTSAAASHGGTPEPRPASSSSTATDQLPGTSTAAFRRRASRPPSVLAPIPEEQEELPKEPGQAACGGASAPSQGRSCSHQGPRCPPKGKAASSEDAAACTKKPPHP